jgi:potassium/chloride transporter 9
VALGDRTMEGRKADGDSSTPKRGLGPRPVRRSEKLGMFSGVFVPTCLNVLSILMFLRFGYILGTSCHLILLTCLSPVSY